MTRATLLAASFLLLVGATHAQQDAPLKVNVEADETPVTRQLKAKVGSSGRYSLTSSVVTTLFLSVTCLRATAEQSHQPIGYSCGFFIEYYPLSLVPIPIVISAGESLCPEDGAGCAENIFERFVEATQDEELTKNEKVLRDSIEVYLKIHADACVPGAKK